MSSLGMQYVSRFLEEPLPGFEVESGYGSILVEMGIFGLILWFFWVGVLLWQGWKVVRNLRETVYFPLGFAIWWYAVVSLVLLMYFGIQFYQNFVNNAYLWLLTGVLYRLPTLALMPQPVPIPRHLRGVPRWLAVLAVLTISRRVAVPNRATVASRSAWATPHPRWRGSTAMDSSSAPRQVVRVKL